MANKLTKEKFLQILDKIYPRGYAGDTVNWQNTWFIGWLGQYDGHVVVETNYDADTIVFWLIHCDDATTPDIVTGYIMGIMAVLMSDMYSDDFFEKDNKTISYQFRE